MYDLNLLRDSDGFQEVEATALFENFGNAHNIVANEETDFVYVVGATANYPGFTCGGWFHRHCVCLQTFCQFYVLRFFPVVTFREYVQIPHLI